MAKTKGTRPYKIPDQLKETLEHIRDNMGASEKRLNTILRMEVLCALEIISKQLAKVLEKQ